MNEQDQQGAQRGDGGYASGRYESIGPGHQHPQAQDDQPTYAAPYESAPHESVRPSSSPYSQPYDSHMSAPATQMPYAHGAAPMPEPERRRGRGWIVALVLALTAVASFALVTLLMQKKSHNHDAMAPNTVATEPSIASGSPNGSVSSSPTSSAGSPTSAGSFPPDATSTCMSNGAEVANDSSDDVRMVAGSQTSCGFLETTRSAVVSQLQADPKATSFSVDPYSASLEKNIPMNCTVSGGYTYCAGGRSAKVWVRNP